MVTHMWLLPVLFPNPFVNMATPTWCIVLQRCIEAAYADLKSKSMQGSSSSLRGMPRSLRVQ